MDIVEAKEDDKLAKEKMKKYKDVAGMSRSMTSRSGTW